MLTHDLHICDYDCGCFFFLFFFCLEVAFVCFPWNVHRHYQLAYIKNKVQSFTHTADASERERRPFLFRKVPQLCISINLYKLVLYNRLALH